MDEHATRILLELDGVDEPIRGRARADDGTLREFVGWLGLIGALEALLPAAPQRTEPD